MSRPLGRALILAICMIFTRARAQTDSFNAALVASQRGDFVTEERIYRRLAEQGNSSAEVNLGDMYLYGEGRPKDATTALVWFRRAAETGYAPAEVRVGLIYENGLGVTPNGDLAVYWFRRASQQDYAPGEGFLIHMLKYSPLIAHDTREAEFWERKLDANPHNRSRSNLRGQF